MKEEKVYLTLQNGQVFEGKRFGARGDVIGELVFTTGMTGYIETLTDPSYYGQIVIQTFPLIGNYGMIPADAESRKPFLTAYVVREYCEAPSNFRCEGKLDDYLKAQGIVGVYGHRHPPADAHRARNGRNECRHFHAPGQRRQ